MLKDEADMSDDIAMLAEEHRLERVATFRNIQAISNVPTAIGISIWLAT